jgi:DNA-binding CsgD family transcriptional regulator
VSQPADHSHHPLIAAWAISYLADAAASIGKHDEARPLIDAAESSARSRDPSVVRSGILLARALVADDHESEALFEQALGVACASVFSRGRFALAYGIWLRRQRRISEARKMLRCARGAFDSIGALPWGDRARQQLRALGDTRAPRTPGARDQLTVQELQVAQLAASGLSNKAIGQKLYLSDRTIGTHLYRIYPKLGITSRSQLAPALAQRPVGS